jgi:plasmid stabilization system protein ParE
MRICWTDLAARDLTEICDYIEERNSTSTAHRVAVSIRDRVTALVEFPESGRPGHKTGTRELVLKWPTIPRRLLP